MTKYYMTIGGRVVDTFDSLATATDIFYATICEYAINDNPYEFLEVHWMNRMTDFILGYWDDVKLLNGRIRLIRSEHPTQSIEEDIDDIVEDLMYAYAVVTGQEIP